MAERSGGDFVAGVLTGALLGASLAMVLAPTTGADMRDTIRAKAREAADRVANP